MNVVICGAGQVGSHTAEVLAAAGHNITVVDVDGERLRHVADTMDVGTLIGSCSSADILREAGAASADLLLAATENDEVNLVTASIGKGIGAARCIARVHHSAFFEGRGIDYREHFGIERLICPEYSTAQAIARMLRNPGALAIEHFARGQVAMEEFPVDEGAPGVGKPLSELALPRGTRLAAIRRGSDVFLPDATSTIAAGDIVIMVGNSSSFQQARAILHDYKEDLRKVVIMGGPSMAVWLCRALRKRHFSIRLFETNRRRAEELAEKLDWVTVIQGNPSDPTVFAEEHIGEADAFVALVDDDEHNILASAWAKSEGVKLAVAVVQKQNYLHLLNHVGIDRAFSPRMVAVKEISQLLESESLRRMASLAEGIIDVYWVKVGPKAKVADEPLRKIKLTPDWMIAAIDHEGQVRVPGADDVLSVGDTVLLIGKHGMENKLRKLFNTGKSS
jgi:trk system potassium uptake protein TrkA